MQTLHISCFSASAQTCARRDPVAIQLDETRLRLGRFHQRNMNVLHFLNRAKCAVPPRCVRQLLWGLISMAPLEGSSPLFHTPSVGPRRRSRYRNRQLALQETLCEGYSQRWETRGDAANRKNNAASFTFHCATPQKKMRGPGAAICCLEMRRKACFSHHNRLSFLIRSRKLFFWKQEDNLSQENAQD